MNIHAMLANDDRIDTQADKDKKFQELVARFCYAATGLPTETVVAAIELLETCSESDSMPSTIGPKSAEMQ